MNMKEIIVAVLTPRKRANQFNDNHLIEYIKTTQFKRESVAVNNYIIERGGVDKVNFHILKSWINNKSTPMGRNDTIQVLIILLIK
jgi:hypothetical protein